MNTALSRGAFSRPFPPDRRRMGRISVSTQAAKGASRLSKQPRHAAGQRRDDAPGDDHAQGDGGQGGPHADVQHVGHQSPGPGAGPRQGDGPRSSTTGTVAVKKVISSFPNNVSPNSISSPARPSRAFFCPFCPIVPYPRRDGNPPPPSVAKWESKKIFHLLHVPVQVFRDGPPI